MVDLARGSWSVEAPQDALLQALAQPTAPAPTLSLYLRTDPRDRANAAQTPGWLVAARNGLRDAGERVEAAEGRDTRLRWRELREQVEGELAALVPADRGRSLVWFLGLDGELDARFVLQLPVREDHVAFAPRPVIAPLIEVLDRSRPVGVMAVSGERVRLLHWSYGVIDEAGEEVFDLDGDGWRPYRGPSSATPGRGRSGATHVERVEARIEEHRDRFFATAARATAQRVEQLGWQRLVLAAEPPVGARFREALTDGVADRIVAELAVNVVEAPDSAIAERVAPEIEAVHEREALDAVAALDGDGPQAAVGPAAVVAALAQRQVGHLVLDPHHRPAAGPMPDVAADLLGDADRLGVPERAVEAAIAGDAHVTTLAVADSATLAHADGMMAALRW
jgi:protein required for attachment to host cells